MDVRYAFENGVENVFDKSVEGFGLFIGVQIAVFFVQIGVFALFEVGKQGAADYSEYGVVAADHIHNGAYESVYCTLIEEMIDNSFNKNRIDLFVDVIVVTERVHLLVVNQICEIVGVGCNDSLPICFGGVVFVRLVCVLESFVVVECRCGEHVVARHFLKRRCAYVVETEYGRNAGFAEFSVKVISFESGVSSG